MSIKNISNRQENVDAHDDNANRQSITTLGEKQYVFWTSQLNCKAKPYKATCDRATLEVSLLRMGNTTALRNSTSSPLPGLWLHQKNKPTCHAPCWNGVKE